MSVVLLCRNEAGFLAASLDSLLEGDYPKSQLEILVVDGMSDDGSREIAGAYAAANPTTVRLVDNRARVTPAAMNIGVQMASGEVVGILSAHATYAPDYIGECIRCLDAYQADQAGATAEYVPRRNSTLGRATALSLSHTLGAGADARYKTGAREPRWVDTASSSFFRREVFEIVGLFNEDLTRSQDVEFSSRMRRAGCKVLLVPSARIKYYARSGFFESARYNFENGVWATYPMRFGRSVVRWRHLVPMVFVSIVMMLAGFAFFVHTAAWMLLAVLGPYFGVLFVAGVHAAVKRRDIGLVPMLPIAIAMLHFAYGLGSIWGAAKAALGRVSDLRSPTVRPS